MAVIEKIRVKLGVLITVLIAIALLSFIIDPATLETAFSFMSSKNKVGEIDGKGVDYTDFQKRVDYYTAITQMSTGSSAISEEQNTAIQNMAWQWFLDQMLFIKNAELAGISVGGDEVLDLTIGDMVSPLVSGNRVFMDAAGVFSPQMVRDFVSAMSQDQSGNLKLYWDYLQSVILDQQYYTKYNSLFTASDYMNPLMLARAVEENNVTSDVDFVMVPFGIADSTITVSESEISSYYSSHKKDYEQNASRDLEYVVFEVVPSDDDINFASDAIQAVYADFATTDNMKNFLMRNSDEPFNPYYFEEGELASISPVFDDYAFAKRVSGVSEIVNVDNRFMAARVMDQKNMSDSAYVQHVLLQGESESLADSLLNVISTGKNTLANVAMTYSADQSMNNGVSGDIGWMTQYMMIPGFEGVLSAKTGKPFILKTDYGTHIVNVKERTPSKLKKQVAILVKEAVASKETFNSFYSKANEIAAKSEGKYELFTQACREANLFPLSAKRVEESSRTLGTYQDTKEVTRWAFEAKAGEVSPIITVNNEYFFVAAVTKIHKEGYAPLEDVRPSIEMYLKNRKLAEARTAEVAQTIEGCTTIEAVAEALGTTVSSRDGIAFSSVSRQQGFDPSFIGAVSGASEGVLTGPVKGNLGVYVFVVKGRETGAFYTEDDARSREQMIAQYAVNAVLPVMMQDTDVKDNRARFY